MQSQKCFFCRAPNNSKNIEYSDRLTNCSDCFGCVMLRNKQYCILNKQYTKEEYFEVIKKIKNHMNDMPYIDKIGRVYKYGEFFPSELSLWPYNESWGHKYFKLTKEEALDRGFNWQDKLPREHNFDLKPDDIPNNILDVNSDILNKIIECEHFGKDCNEQCIEIFKILPNELSFYRQMNLALPRLCPICRHYSRLKFMNSTKLYHCKCMKEGCNNEFNTSYNPDNNIIVYCEKCYQAEFI